MKLREFMEGDHNSQRNKHNNNINDNANDKNALR